MDCSNDGTHHWKCFWLVGLGEKSHPRLFWCAVALLRVAVVTGSHDVLPDGLSSLRAGDDVVVVQGFEFPLDPAILTTKTVPGKDVDFGELHAALHVADGLLQANHGRHLHRERRRSKDLVVLIHDFHFAEEEHTNGGLPADYFVRAVPGGQEQRLRGHGSPHLRLFLLIVVSFLLLHHSKVE